MIAVFYLLCAVATVKYGSVAEFVEFHRAIKA